MGEVMPDGGGRRPDGHDARGRAICVAPDRAAAEAGAAILRRGGNAFDAAAAAAFMEAVVAPASCGIGGYGAAGIGFVAGTGTLVALDAGTVAPRAATPGMFPVVPARDPNDFKMRDARHKSGPLSVAVPGVLGGVLTLLETWGRLDRGAVMAPAIAAARAGVPLTPGRALTWLSLKAESEGAPAPDRARLPAVVAMPELAETLEAIAAEGAALFYSGRIGRAIADDVRARGGILTREDMAAYRTLAVSPVSVEVRGQRLATPPPPSGGLTSLQIVALFDRLERRGKAGPSGSVAALEALLEIDKVVWEERLTRRADPRFMAGPPEALLADSHLDALCARVEAGLSDPGPGRLVAPDPLRGTVHLAAADSEGNLVAWTQTHGGGFGSGIMVKGTGIVLGHGMCRFDPRPGWANAIAPGKRPLHNMAPIVAVKEGRAVLAAGASGGRTIVNNAAALAIGGLIQQLDPAASVAAPRLQCETIEPAVVERSAGAGRIASLRARGHRITEATRDAGSAHLLAREGDLWAGAAEPRLADAAAIVA
jgi:gamma-glutamyltranspeptidase/glutathione hydrolase